MQAANHAREVEEGRLTAFRKLDDLQEENTALRLTIQESAAKVRCVAPQASASLLR
jgi:hypothetical protein